MAEFADNLKGVATDLIGRFGENVVIDYNGVPDSSKTIKGFLDPYKPEQIKGSIVEGDVRVAISSQDVPAGVEFKTTSHVLANGQVWEVLGINESRAQGDPVLLEAHCRKVGAEDRAAVGRPRF